MAKAEELVRYFHKLFHDAAQSYPSSKELAHASDLIAQHGYERARYIIEYSHRKATDTKYEPQTFSGILHYATPALVVYDEAQRNKKQTAAIEACEACDSAGRIHFQKADSYTFIAICPHDLRMI